MTGFNKKKEHSNHKRICGVYIHVYSTQLCQQQDTIHDTNNLQNAYESC